VRAVGIEEWVAKLRILDPSRVRVVSVRTDTVDVEVDGALHAGVRPRRPFPYTHPECVILYGPGDEEIGIIRDYRRLDERSRELLERALGVIYFTPRVKRIIRVSSRGGRYEWLVETDRGVVKFETWSSCTRFLSNGKVVIKDVNGNVYCVENFFRLDKRSQLLLSIFV